MLTKQVAKLCPIERFIYWITERHSIFLKKQAGKTAPWTDDEVLQKYFFTNPYRENDKTTVWFRENVRKTLDGASIVLFATVCFRWFNYIPTGQILNRENLLVDWDSERAIDVLDEVNGKVFTGAYMIKAGNGPPGCKIANVCKALDAVWEKEQDLVTSCKRHRSIEQLCKELSKFKHLGGFMSYEVACDLRYTHLLRNASDIMTWANPGPGCRRGLNRLYGRPVRAHVPTKQCIKEMQELLVVCHKQLPKSMPKFEMREVEHGLCESDKYNRMLFNDGKIKRKYSGEGL